MMLKQLAGKQKACSSTFKKAQKETVVARRKAWTKIRQAGFLEELTNHGNVSEAARAMGMSRQYAYDFRDGREDRYPPHPEFAELWDLAEQEFLDKIDAEIFRRAVPGIKRLKQKTTVEISEDGTEKVIAIVREATTYHSDILLKFIAENRHPNYNKAKKQELTGKDGGPIVVKTESDFDLTKLSDEKLLELHAIRELARKSDDDAG